MARRIAVLAGTTLAILILGTAFTVQASAEGRAAATTDSASVELPAPPDAPTPDTMLVEIQAAMDDARLRTAELQERIEHTTDTEATIALHDEVEAVKLGVHIRILEIQRDWAAREGRTEAVAQLSGAIDQLTAQRDSRSEGVPDRDPDSGSQ